MTTIPYHHPYMTHTAAAAVLPVAVAALCLVPLGAAAVPCSIGGVHAVAACHDDAPGAVSVASMINPTTVEVRFTDGRMLTIDFYGDNIFRMFRDDNGGVLRDPVASPPASILVGNARRGVSPLELFEDGGAIRVRTKAVSISIDKRTGTMTVTDVQTGKPVMEGLSQAVIGKKGVSLELKAHDGEYFYGGGVQNGRFSHRGQSIAIENTNNWVDGGVASPTPFYWSTMGYGILWNTFCPGRYDFGTEGSGRVRLSHSDDHLDVFVMVGQTPVSLLQSYYQLTGNPVLLPKFGFYEGHLNAYNRDYWKEADGGFMLYEDGRRYNESQKDNGGTRESLNGDGGGYQFSARAAIDRYTSHDMPLGWFLPNDGYGAGYGHASTLDGNIANLRSFGEYARSKGVEIGLWTQSDLHPKAGVEPLLQRDIIKEVRDAGVRVLKTDVAWVGRGYSFGLNGVTDVAQVMPYYGNDARPFIISLDGWAGTQRYAGIWSGDQTGGDWEYIRFHIPTFIGSGLSGQPNITSDVDGIFGGKNVAVNVREYQWKTFTPMELNMDGWGSNPKYPQALGEPAASINRSYLKLKSMLMPYTYSIAHEAVSGKPMVRAMMLDYPSCYTLGTATQYQFMYGPSLLVAPIYRDTRADKDGNDIRNGIFLPEGRWVDYFSGDTYEGGRVINEYDAPLWKIPVFVKADAVIPMTEPNNNLSQVRSDYRCYEIYATRGGSSSFDEYDDDGDTQDYLRGRSTMTHVSASADKRGTLTVSISPTTGTYTGFEPEKQTELRVNVTAAPRKLTMRVGGRSVRLRRVQTAAEYAAADNVWYYDPAPNLNRFSTPGTPAAAVVLPHNPQVMVKTAHTDVRDGAMQLRVDGFEFDTSGRLATHGGQLTAPVAAVEADSVGVFALTPSWQPQANADYYEIEFDGMLYSTIRSSHFTIDGLAPETAYTMRVRAVNKDGVSDWTAVSATTKSNPLELAVRDIKGQTSCRNQTGQGIGKLFDFDEKSVWHSEWGRTDALPCDVTADLRAVTAIDRIEYVPREDAANGTLLSGTVSFSTDRQAWTAPVAFEWKRDASVKTLRPADGTEARYVRLHIDKAVGGFASGRQLYVFRKPGTQPVLQGDINRDGRIDENDLTSYMNYTGLRRGDSDFDYVSAGDINGNGLIDAYDISTVSTELDGGVSLSADKCSGSLVAKSDKTAFAAGDTVSVTVSGRKLHFVNALSFALPYDASLLEYVGISQIGMKDMVNLTYDRLHTNGQKELFPTFVNRGNNFLLDDGDHDLFVIKFRARKAGRFSLKMRDGLLVDRNLGCVAF